MSFVNKSSTRFAPKVKPRGQLRRRSSALPTQQKQAIADALKETAKTIALSSSTSNSAISDTPTISEISDKPVALPISSTPESSQLFAGFKFSDQHSAEFQSSGAADNEPNPPFLLTPAATQEPVTVISPAPITVTTKPSNLENETSRPNRFSTVSDRKSNLISQPRLTTIAKTSSPVRPQTPISLSTGDSRPSTPIPTSPRVVSSPSLSMPTARLSSINASSLRSPNSAKSPITSTGPKPGTPLSLLRSPKTIVDSNALLENNILEPPNEVNSKTVHHNNTDQSSLPLLISTPNRNVISSTIPGSKPVTNAFPIPSNVSVGQPVSSLRSSIKVARTPALLDAPISADGSIISRGLGMRGGDEDGSRSSTIINSSIVTDQLGYNEATKSSSFETVNRPSSKQNNIETVAVTEKVSENGIGSGSDDDNTATGSVDIVSEAAAVARTSRSTNTRSTFVTKRKVNALTAPPTKRVKKEERGDSSEAIMLQLKGKSSAGKRAEVNDDGTLPDSEKTARVDRRIFEIGTHKDEHTYVVTGDDISMLMKDRQRRSRSPTNHDKVIIDVESVTMAQLCGDLHIGKLSDNHSLVMTAREKRMKRKLQDKLTRDSRASSVSSREGSPAIALENIVEKGKNDESFGSDDEKKDAKAMMNEELIKNTPINVPSRQSGTLQLRMIDGRIEINADSLHVNRSEGAMEIASATDKNVEEIMRFDKYVNSASYSKRERPERWDNDETSKFYKVLSQWGTDFNLIAQMFPYRNRRQIKSKFKLEEKKNPLKVHLALVRKLPVDIDTYEAAGGGKIMDDPHDIEVEIEKIRTEHEEWLTKEKESIAEARKADSAAALKSEQAMFNMGPPKRQSKSERLRLLRANQTIIGTVGEVKRELHEVAF